MKCRTITNLPSDVLLAMLRNLGASDVLRVRQTCGLFYAITTTKQLWIDILHSDVLSRNLLIPPYCRSLDTLSSSETEALVSHALRLHERTRSHQNHAVSHMIPLHQKRSVTWVQIVSGQLMLAACSDSSSSVISLWSINRLEARIGGDSAPLAEAFLSAPVSSGAVEVQNGAVIIALGLHSRVPCLDILSVHDDRGHPIFVRMFHLEGSSYVRTLRGDWVGIAFYQNTSVPCLVNWKTGAVVQLHPFPDPNGCCICMAMKGRIVATVFPWKIEIYQFEENDARATFLQKIEFNRQVSYADIAFSPLTAFHNKAIENDKNQDVLSVVTAEDEGISVYTMSCSPDGQFELHLVWKHTPQRHEEIRQDACDPLISMSGESVSWLDAPCAFGRHISFCAARLPPIHTPLGKNPDIYELYDPQMPAQYFAGVRNYDAARGVIVFGSGFGELALYDLSGSEPFGLCGCFQPVVFPLLDGEDVVSTDLVPSHPAPPFPYSGPYLTSPEMKRELIEIWKSEALAHIPDGWNTDWEYCDRWTIFTGSVGSYAWLFERAHHFLGQPVPLLQNEDLILFKAGGLLFLWVTDAEELHVVDPGTTLDDMVVLIDHGRNLPLTRSSFVHFKYREGWRYELWDWEVQILGRNRWKELKDRGGEVDVSRTDNLPDLADIPEKQP